MVLETSEAVTFGEVVQPGSDVTRTYGADGAATVERIKIVTFPGQEKALKITPQIREKGSGRVRSLVQGDGTFSGDGEIFEIDLSKPIQDDEELVLTVDNTATTEPYSYRFTAEVDYRNGLSGVVEAAIGVFR